MLTTIILTTLVIYSTFLTWYCLKLQRNFAKLYKLTVDFCTDQMRAPLILHLPKLDPLPPVNPDKPTN